MNNTSEKVIVPVNACGMMEVIGEELSQAHTLYCALREGGFNKTDIDKLAAGPRLLDYLLVFLRGKLDEIPDEIINLDRHPGNPQNKGKEINLIVDNRLGGWVADWSDSQGMKIGGLYVDIIRPKGYGVLDGNIFSRNSVYPYKLEDKPIVDLNAQTAQWYDTHYWDGARNLFERVGQIVDSSDWNDDRIFFLGTLWAVNGVPHAMALVSDTNGDIECRLEPIPRGKWPPNCYLALLVEDPAMLQEYK